MRASIIILIITSLLFAGCYTTENYSDTPENVISGKSQIKKDDGFMLDKILLKSGRTLNLTGCFTAFMECGRDSCGKLFYASRDRVCDTIPKTDSTPMRLKYREPSQDTVNVSDIKTMFYSKRSFDGGSTAYLIAVIAVLPVLIAIYSIFNGDRFKY